MNKELVEKMREAVENSYDRVPNTGIRLLNPAKVVDNCAAVASEHYGDKWVKCNESKPEKMKDNKSHSIDVLVLEGDTMIIGYYYFDEKMWVDEVNGTPINNANLWHPLPQPPQQ